MTTSNLVCAYLFSIFVGHLLASGALQGIAKALKWWAKRNRRKLDSKDTGGVWWLVALVGISERAVVTTLVIWVPSLTATFIGAWILLKFAGGWGRFKESSLHIRAIHMSALIGNVVSFACAIAAGLYVNPGAVSLFGK